jgi:hypothetical protein
MTPNCRLAGVLPKPSALKSFPNSCLLPLRLYTTVIDQAIFPGRTHSATAFLRNFPPFANPSPGRHSPPGIKSNTSRSWLATRILEACYSSSSCLRSFFPTSTGRNHAERPSRCSLQRQATSILRGKCARSRPGPNGSILLTHSIT